MTTAARPTYFAAQGRQSFSSFSTRKVSSKDQTAHTKIKYRQLCQNSSEEVRDKDFRKDLEEKELKYLQDEDQAALSFLAEEEKKVNVQLLLKDKPELDPDSLKKYDDADIDIGNDSDSSRDSGKEADGFDSSR